MISHSLRRGAWMSSQSGIAKEQRKRYYLSKACMSSPERRSSDIVVSCWKISNNHSRFNKAEIRNYHRATSSSRLSNKKNLNSISGGQFSIYSYMRICDFINLFWLVFFYAVNYGLRRKLPTLENLVLLPSLWYLISTHLVNYFGLRFFIFWALSVYAIYISSLLVTISQASWIFKNDIKNSNFHP